MHPTPKTLLKDRFHAFCPRHPVAESAMEGVRFL